MYKKVTLPKVTTLRNIEVGIFTDDERKVLQFIQDNKIPVTVTAVSPNDPEWFDVEIGNVISIPELSAYHISCFEE